MYNTDQNAVLLATYNGERYLREQLDSLFEQTNQNWHLFVHDDGSSDQTATIIQNYQMRFPDRITILSGLATGNSRDNFFYLLSQVQAPYYFFCDQDDIWLPKKIEKTVQRMKEFEEKELPCLVFTDLKVVDESLNCIADKMEQYQKLNYKDLSFKQLMVQAAVTGCTMMINRKLRNKMLLCRGHEDIIMHDWWASMIAAKFGKISCMDEPLILYRQHSGNSIGAKDYSVHKLLRKGLKERNTMKASVLLTMEQARKFSEVFHSSPDSPEAIFGSLQNAGKAERIHAALKYHFHKTPWSRNIGFFLAGL